MILCRLHTYLSSFFVLPEMRFTLSFPNLVGLTFHDLLTFFQRDPGLHLHPPEELPCGIFKLWDWDELHQPDVKRMGEVTFFLHLVGKEECHKEVVGRVFFDGEACSMEVNLNHCQQVLIGPLYGYVRQEEWIDTRVTHQLVEGVPFRW